MLKPPSTLTPPLDLPDPSPEPLASPPASDDLLSQLAVTEIERLLAVDAVAESASAAADRRGNGSPPITFPLLPEGTGVSGDRENSPPNLATQLDELFYGLKPTRETPAPSKHSRPETGAPVIKPPPIPELNTAPVKSAARPAVVVQPQPASAADDPELLEYVNARRPDLVTTTAAIPSGLETSVAELGGQSIDPLTPPIAPEPQGAPTWICFLEWLNSPFGFVPDSVRIALGKLAILTLLNALAMLIYVLILRGR